MNDSEYKSEGEEEYTMKTKDGKKVDLIDEKNETIIDDIKNLDVKPLGDAINTLSDKIAGENTTRKIGIAFPYNSIYANGIGRFITVTSKYLLKTGKYNSLGIIPNCRQASNDLGLFIVSFWLSKFMSNIDNIFLFGY